MTDYTTLADVKAYIGTVQSSEDALVSQFITRASRWIDTFCQRQFTARTETRLFDALRDVSGQTLYVDDDLLGIVTVTNGDGTTLSASNYVFLPTNETPKYGVRLKASSGVTWTYNTDPEEAISINGTWGYNNGTVPPDDVKHAATRLAAWFYEQKDAPFNTVAFPELGALEIPPGVPPDIEATLIPFRRSEVGSVRHAR
jgi:hypothetical protein